MEQSPVLARQHLILGASRDAEVEFYFTEIDHYLYAVDTALHAAVTHRYVTVVQFLLDHGAAVNVRNKAGKTPSDLLDTARRDIEKPASAASTTTPSSELETASRSATERIAALLAKPGATR